MPLVRVDILSGFQRRWIAEVLRYIPLPVLNPMKRQGTTCGVFGQGYLRPAILQFLTEAGTDVSWWNGWRDFAAKMTGSVLTMR